MSIDGVFVHYLINELKVIEGTKINKINRLNDTDYSFNLPRKIKLLISSDSNHPHMRLTQSEIISSSQTSNFFTNLKRYFENSYIESINQYNNDRIFILTVNHYDELGFMNKYFLILEAFGRNSNLIITNSQYIIVDSVKKTSLLEEKGRIITPKAKYQFPESNKINPYTITNFDKSCLNNLEGVSILLQEEIKYTNSLSCLNNDPNPVIIKTENKNFFYAFDLLSLKGEKTYYNSISEMLDVFYSVQNEVMLKNNEQKILETYLKKEISKLDQKKAKQQKELETSFENLIYEQIGNIVSSNLHLIKKGMSSITLFDYYNNDDITVELDPLLTPTENLNSFYNKYKKSKRAIDYLEVQIEQTSKDKIYFEGILEQLNYSKNLDLKEIIEELNLKNRMNIVKTAKKTRPNITVYNDIYGGVILVGKNNIQNNYLTHTLASKDDLFFHAKSIGGSHVILRHGYTDERSVTLAADIAAYYSKYRTSVNANVDCTKVKNVKKVPGTKGSFVTYNTYQTIFANPDLDKIKSQIKS